MIETIPIGFAEPFLPLVHEHWDYKLYYGGRGGAKSWHFAIALLTLARKFKLRILCTREIQNSIKDSVHKLLKDKIETHNLNDFRVTERNIINERTGSEFIFKGLLRNISEIKSMESVDITWLEEAQAVSAYSLETILPTVFRNKNSELWGSFNRFSENDPIWDLLCKNPDPETTLLVNVNWDSNPWFPEALERQRLKAKKENYEMYLHTWEGEPLGQDAKAAISRPAINRAMDNNIDDPVGGKVVGADIAREGDDKIVFYMRKGLKVIKSKVFGKSRIPNTARALMEFVDYDKTIPINIDSTGMPGVGDIIDEAGYSVNFINFGSDAKDKDLYPNCVSEMWFNFKEIVESEDEPPDLPDDVELKEELAGRLFLRDKKERRLIEPKKYYKDREGKSPDRADAMIMCFYNPENMIQGEVMGFSERLISDDVPW